MDQTDKDEGLEERAKADNQGQVSGRGRKEGSKFHTSAFRPRFCASLCRLMPLSQDNINEPITPESGSWKVGPGFIEVKDIVLVRLVHVSKGSWQAEFRVFA